MDWLDLVIMCFATWRMSSLITNEEGPFNVFLKLRSLAGITHHDDGTIANIPDKFTAKLISCLWCVSIWMGGIIYLIWLFCPVAVWIIAISAGAIIVDRLKGS